MSDNIFLNWLETELAMKEREDMARRKKIEVPIITDLQLVFTNKVKSLLSEIQDSGVEHITYADISNLDKSYDAVVEEANLKHQQHEIEHGEDKGTVVKAWYKDLVRANHPDVYVEKEND